MVGLVECIFPEEPGSAMDGPLLGSLNLKQIEAFRWVMISGSTSQAAAILNVSQPAISRLIHNLEAQVRYRLFLRQGGRLQPTPEAEALFRGVERVYPGLAHLSTLMQNIALSDAGLVRIVATVPMIQRLIPEALARFRARMPDIRISVKTMVRRELREWLDGQQFDIGLATLPLDYPAASTVQLASLDCVCVLPPGHRLAEAPVVRAADLARETFISIVPDTVLRMRVDEVFERLGVERDLAIETQSGASICNMVAAGLGVSVVDVFTASGFTRHGLVAKPFLPGIRLDFGLLLPVRRPRSGPVDAMIDAMQESARAFEETHHWG
jgi:DNA-binding transcriptional LysR family regulator